MSYCSGSGRLLLMAGVLLGTLFLFGMACGEAVAETEVTIDAVESSGQLGVATLRAIGDQTEVVVKITPGPPGNDPQPAHIHYVQCGPKLGTVHYPLEDVVAGESTPLIIASSVSLQNGDNAINIHESYPNIRIYTACGKIARW